MVTDNLPPPKKETPATYLVGPYFVCHFLVVVTDLVGLLLELGRGGLKLHELHVGGRAEFAQVVGQVVDERLHPVVRGVHLVQLGPHLLELRVERFFKPTAEFVYRIQAIK